MISSRELRAIADFTDKVHGVFNAMVSSQPVEFHFDDDVPGGYILYRQDGTPLGKVQITDAGEYEFVPSKE